MPQTLFKNAQIEITTEAVCNFESKVNVNGKTLLVIQNKDEEKFKTELLDLINKFKP